jgi:hypothetical protein
VRRSWTAKLLTSVATAVGLWAALVVPADAATVDATQYGFSFSLPLKWTQIPLNSNDIGAIIGQAAKGDPSLENVLDQQAVQASKKGLKVFAVGPVTGGFFPNLNVGVTSAAGAPTGSAFVSLMATEVKITLNEAGATHVTAATAHLPLGEAVQVGYELKLTTSGHSALVHGLQFYIEHGSHLYVITFSATAPAAYRPVAHLVVTSWRWHPTT